MDFFDVIFKLFFGYINMPINVFGNNSKNFETKSDTRLLTKTFFKNYFYASNIEEVTDMKIQNRIKNLRDPINIREAVSKNYVDNSFNNPSTTKNTAHVEINDKNPDNVRFVKVNSISAVEEHLTDKYYFDQAMSNSEDEPTLVRSSQDKDFEKFTLTNINSITSNTPAVNENQVITE